MRSLKGLPTKRLKRSLMINKINMLPSTWIVSVQFVTKRLKMLPKVPQRLLPLTQLESKKPVDNLSGRRLSRKRSLKLNSGRKSKTKLELNDWLIFLKTKSQKMRI